MITTTVIVRSHVARSLLGWQPTKPGLVESVRALLLAHIAGNAGHEGVMEDLLKGYSKEKQ